MGRPCNAEFSPEKEYVGHMYGDWEIISSDVKYSDDKKAYFLCRCHCELCSQDGVVPTEKYVRHYYLYTGRSQGCRRGGSKHGHPKTRFKNKYDLTGEYGVGYINDNEHPFYFDKEDFDIIKDYIWSRRERGYIYTFVRNKKDIKTITMHRLVMESNYGEIDSAHMIDHINHDTSDNRKSNLRIATVFENALNKQMSSPFAGHGISKDKHGKWVVVFRRNKERYYGGRFSNFIDAYEKRIAIEPDINSEFQYFYKSDIKNE